MRTGKNKNKQRKERAAEVSEVSILKALNELETLAKGDALEDQDPEGGFATEGEPLSKESEGHGVAKAASASDMMSESPDDESASPDDMSSESPDDESDDAEKSTAKSLRERADEDDTLRKGFNVSTFLESFIDQASATMTDMERAISKRLEKSAAALDGHVEAQRDFNRKLAQGMVFLGRLAKQQSEQIEQLNKALDATLSQAHVPQRRAVLSKSEVVQPQFGGTNPNGGLASLKPKQVGDWLTDKLERGQLDPGVIVAWESAHYDPAALPVQVQKSLEADLCKA